MYVLPQFFDMEKNITNKKLKQELIKVGYPTDEEINAIKRKLIELDRKGSFLLVCGDTNADDPIMLHALGNHEAMEDIIYNLLCLFANKLAEEKLNGARSPELHEVAFSACMRSVLLDIVEYAMESHPSMLPLYAENTEHVDRLDQTIYIEDVDEETVRDSLRDLGKALRRAQTIMHTYEVKKLGLTDEDAIRDEYEICAKNLSAIVDDALGLSSNPQDRN